MEYAQVAQSNAPETPEFVEKPKFAFAPCLCLRNTHRCLRANFRPKKIMPQPPNSPDLAPVTFAPKLNGLIFGGITLEGIKINNL